MVTRAKNQIKLPISSKDGVVPPNWQQFAALWLAGNTSYDLTWQCSMYEKPLEIILVNIHNIFMALPPTIFKVRKEIETNPCLWKVTIISEEHIHNETGSR